MSAVPLPSSNGRCSQPPTFRLRRRDQRPVIPSTAVRRDRCRARQGVCTILAPDFWRDCRIGPWQTASARPAPPVPPVLSGRDQASPTPAMTTRTRSRMPMPPRNTVRLWQLHDCLYRDFSDNKREARHHRSARMPICRALSRLACNIARARSRLRSNGEA